MYQPPTFFWQLLTFNIQIRLYSKSQRKGRLISFTFADPRFWNTYSFLVHSIQEAVHYDFYRLSAKVKKKWLRFGISNQGCGCFLVGRCLASLLISHGGSGGSCNIQRASWHNCMVFDFWGYYRIARNIICPSWLISISGAVRVMPVSHICSSGSLQLRIKMFVVGKWKFTLWQSKSIKWSRAVEFDGI